MKGIREEESNNKNLGKRNIYHFLMLCLLVYFFVAFNIIKCWWKQLWAPECASDFFQFEFLKINFFYILDKAMSVSVIKSIFLVFEQFLDTNLRIHEFRLPFQSKITSSLQYLISSITVCNGYSFLKGKTDHKEYGGWKD